jgi:5'-methylthioadenosine phosphorylase/5'-methylthioinosine phosphorylase
MISIIGGTGFDQLDDFRETGRQRIDTPYGAPSDDLVQGFLGDTEFLFLPRHGVAHSIPPHRINYRANIHALKAAGAGGVVALAAVGGIAADMGPGELVLPDQVIDYTWGREHTFHDGAGDILNHVDFTEPYAASLRDHLIAAASRAGVDLHTTGTYAATQGPRLESAAEIDRLERDGADIVGMTGMPEAALAREAGLDYAALALVVNPAAGRSNGTITMELIRENLSLCSKKALDILRCW